jgi:putative transcriptional regulator
MHSKSDITPPSGYLSGQLLVATPLVTSPGFSHAVIFMCAHDVNGAMGIIINHIIENISYRELFEQLAIKREGTLEKLPVHYGGPVEINRGFVIYNCEEGAPPPTDALITVNNIAISSSIHILRDIAAGNGPKERILALGYAGWAAGQLETEMEANSWISVPASKALIFDTENDTKWKRAAENNGIDIRKLTSDAGHA